MRTTSRPSPSRRSARRTAMVAAFTTATLLTLPACAQYGGQYASPYGGTYGGPRVGEVVGAPSVVNTTIAAKVISSTPVVAQVAVPTQVCRDETYETPTRSSGAGAVLGAIAGGAAGNAVGKGAGNALATGIGIIGGAIVGNHIETDGRPGNLQTVRRCDPQTSYENRVVAYSVTYEYAGQRYTTQTVQEPGPTLPLQVTITPLVQSPAPTTAPSPYTYPDDGRRQRRWN